MVQGGETGEEFVPLVARRGGSRGVEKDGDEVGKLRHDIRQTAEFSNKGENQTAFNSQRGVELFSKFWKITK